MCSHEGNYGTSEANGLYRKKCAPALIVKWLKAFCKTDIANLPPPCDAQINKISNILLENACYSHGAFWLAGRLKLDINKCDKLPDAYFWTVLKHYSGAYK